MVVTWKDLLLCIFAADEDSARNSHNYKLTEILLYIAKKIVLKFCVSKDIQSLVDKELLIIVIKANLQPTNNFERFIKYRNQSWIRWKNIVSENSMSQ